MGEVDVIIFHPLPRPGAGRLELALAGAREDLAAGHVAGFHAGGAATVRISASRADERRFGARLRQIGHDREPDHGLVLLGSGALPLATRRDREALVAAAAGAGRRALANNRYSADAVALTAEAAGALLSVPAGLPGDNALPRWLEEVAGIDVADLGRRWRLAVDLDSPLDLVLIAGMRASSAGLSTAADALPDAGLVSARLAAVAGVLADRRAELVVAGRTSAGTLGWLERHASCRVRALVEERGLRASTPLAQRGDRGRSRPARSILGALLDRDGPAALGDRLAELGDAAVVDMRILLAHRLGPDEARWPPAADRFAADMLQADSIGDRWLAELTRSAADATIPIVLGGHSLVGPGIRLLRRFSAKTDRFGRRARPAGRRRVE